MVVDVVVFGTKLYFLTSWSRVFSEANNHSASQKITSLLWNPTRTAYYHVHKSPPLVSVLSQISPVHVVTPSFFKIHFTIVLPSNPSEIKLYVSGLNLIQFNQYSMIYNEYRRTDVS
jgi:hypothetical protein